MVSDSMSGGWIDAPMGGVSSRQGHHCMGTSCYSGTSGARQSLGRSYRCSFQEQGRA